MTARRSHYHRSLQSITGAFARGASVAICEPGIPDLISEPLYGTAIGEGIISNPFLAQDGLIDFYLGAPRNVSIRVSFGGNEIVIDDQAVLPPADTLLFRDPTDPDTDLLTKTRGDTLYIPIDSLPINLDDLLTEQQGDDRYVTIGSIPDLDDLTGPEFAEASSPDLVPAASVDKPDVKQFHAPMVGTDFWADAPGKVRRSGSQFFVPEYWLDDAINPTAFSVTVQNFIAGLYDYGYDRAGFPTSGTATGLGKRRNPFELELVWSNNQHWSIGLDHTSQSKYRGMFGKRLGIDLLPGLRHVGLGTGAALYGDFSLGGFVIGTPYKPFSELAYDRVTGALSTWVPGKQGSSVPAWDQKTLFSGGRGATGCRQWDYVAARAIIGADVSRGDSTFAVDWVDGIDHANRNAMRALNPAIPADDPLAVGDTALLVLGMNPIDSHEAQVVVMARVLAINGNGTDGFTTTGPGTITLDYQANQDYPLSSMVWDLGSNRKVYNLTTIAAGGFDNIVNHSIVKCDPRRIIRDDAGIHNLGIIGENPDTNGFQIGPSLGVEVENPWGYANGGAFAKFTHCQNARVTGTLHHYGGDTAAGLSGNNGKVTSVTTATASIERAWVQNPVGVVFQSESDGKQTIGQVDVENGNTTRGNTDPIFNALGNAFIEVKGPVTITGRPTVLDATSADRPGTISIDGPIRLHTSGILRTRVDRWTPGARPYLLTNIKNGGTTAAPAPEAIDRMYDPALSDRFDVLIEAGVASSQVFNLPTGLMRIIAITAPASLAGTSVRILDSTAGSQIVLTGRAATDGSGLAPIDDGTDNPVARGRLYSTIAAWNNGDVDSFVTILGINPDSSDFISAIVGTGTDSTGSYALLDDPLPRDLSNQAFTIGSSVVAGKTGKVNPAITDSAAAAGWNLRHQTASSNTRIVITTDGTQAAGKFGIYWQWFPPRDQRKDGVTRLGNDTALTDGSRRFLDIAKVRVNEKLILGPGVNATGELFAYAVGQFAYPLVTSPATPVLTADPDLVKAVEANRVYDFELFASADVDPTTDMLIGWQAPAGSGGTYWVIGAAPTLAANATVGTSNALATDLASAVTIGGTGSGAGKAVGLHVRGLLRTGANAGNFGLMMSQAVASGANTLTRRRDGFLRLTPRV